MMLILHARTHPYLWGRRKPSKIKLCFDQSVRYVKTILFLNDSQVHKLLQVMFSMPNHNTEWLEHIVRDYKPLWWHLQPVFHLDQNCVLNTWLTTVIYSTVLSVSGEKTLVGIAQCDRSERYWMLDLWLPLTQVIPVKMLQPDHIFPPGHKDDKAISSQLLPAIMSSICSSAASSMWLASVSMVMAGSIRSQVFWCSVENE